MSFAGGTTEPADPKFQQAQEEIRRALFDLLERYIQLVDVQPTKQRHQSASDIRLFSDELKEWYRRSACGANRSGEKPESAKRKRGSSEESCDSSDEEAARMELLASVAVSAGDLSTSNRQKKAKRR